MKKVLIIGHFWPYRGGSKRMIGLAKYLSEFGWEPIILTGPLNRKPDIGAKYIEVEYRNIFGFRSKIDLSDQISYKVQNTPPFFKKLLRNLFKYIAEVIAYPDEYKYWKYPVIESVKDILKEEKIDAMISVWPVTSHIIAKELKAKYGIAWIADFPDLWSQNYCYSYGPIRKFFDRRLEAKTIKSADILTSISQPLAEKMKELHKEKQIYSITHGFDPIKVNNLSSNLTNKFTITYTGQIYKGKQDPSKFLTALKNLISNRIINPNDVEVRFYGPKLDWLETMIRNYRLSGIVKQYGMIPHEDSIKKQWESQLLILFSWEDKKRKGVYTGKIFEYLAAQRPILATGGISSDVVEDLLKETNAGVYSSDIDDIQKKLKKFYLEYKQKGRVDYAGNIGKINQYSHREMAKKFADILNKIIKT